jgi:hypothetical protein
VKGSNDCDSIHSEFRHKRMCANDVQMSAPEEGEEDDDFAAKANTKQRLSCVQGQARSQRTTTTAKKTPSVARAVSFERAEEEEGRKRRRMEKHSRWWRRVEDYRAVQSEGQSTLFFFFLFSGLPSHKWSSREERNSINWATVGGEMTPKTSFLSSSSLSKRVLVS